LLPGFVTSSQIVDGNIYHPYYSIFFNKNHTNFFDQTEKLSEFPNSDGIYVDTKTKNFLLKLKKTLSLNHYKSGYPIFGFNMPGVIFLLDGVSPGMPYYFNKERDIKAFECFKLENNPPIFLIPDQNSIQPELIDLMHKKGIYFPNEYDLKRSIYFPNTNSNLKIYFPKSFSTVKD